MILRFFTTVALAGCISHSAVASIHRCNDALLLNPALGRLELVRSGPAEPHAGRVWADVSKAPWEESLRFIEVRLHTGQPGQKIFLLSDLTEWKTDWRMRLQEEPGGNYLLRIPSPWMKELAYHFDVDGTHLSPETTLRKDAALNVIIETGFREDPLFELNPGVLDCRRSELPFTDGKGQPRTVTVLDAFTRGKPHQRTVTLYFEDGDEFLSDQVSHVIANLSAMPDMPGFTAVLIPPVDRDKEYIFSRGPKSAAALWENFLIQTVVPEIERKFQTGGAPEQRALMGVSLGGLSSTDIGLRNGDVFGNIGPLSGSFWYGRPESIVKRITRRKGKDTRVYMTIGAYEDNDIRRHNKRVRKEMTAAGMLPKYKLFPTTHDQFAWNNQLSEMLRSLFSRH